MVTTRRAAAAESTKRSSKITKCVKSKKTAKWKAAPPEHDRLTRQTSRRRCFQRVYQTVELLEEILVCLDVSSLWRCQRVCKQFQATITQSVRLQEAMMLLSSSEKAQQWRFIDDSQPERVATIPCFKAVPLDEHQVHKPWAQPLTWEHPILFPVRLCPLLRHRALGRYQRDYTVPSSHSRNKPSGHRKDAAIKRIAWNFTYGDVNGDELVCEWRMLFFKRLGRGADMFISSPPCSRADVSLVLQIFDIEDPGIYVTLRRRIERKEGLRVRDLYEQPLTIAGDIDWLPLSDGMKSGMTNGDPIVFLNKHDGWLKGNVWLDVRYTKVILDRVVIPSEEEWREVELRSKTELIPS